MAIEIKLKHDEGARKVWTEIINLTGSADRDPSKRAKLNEKEVKDVIDEIAEERVVEAKENFKKDIKALIQKKEEYEKNLSNKLSELEKEVNKQQEEFTKQANQFKNKYLQAKNANESIRETVLGKDEDNTESTGNSADQQTDQPS